MFSVFVCATVLGGVYCVMLGADSFSTVSDYLTNYVSADITADIKTVLFDSIKLYALFLVCSFFRFGKLPAAVVLGGEVFSASFLVSCMVRCFGFSGAIFGACVQLHYILLLPAMLVFSAFDTKTYAFFAKNQKKLKIFLIFFQLIMLSIFCGCAYFQTYVNTTFMNLCIGELIK